MMLTLKFIMKVNTEAENAVVVAMAEEAAAIDNNIGRDYWIGGVRTENGTWMWQSGDPMDYTNFQFLDSNYANDQCYDTSKIAP